MMARIFDGSGSSSSPKSENKRRRNRYVGRRGNETIRQRTESQKRLACSYMYPSFGNPPRRSDMGLEDRRGQLMLKGP